MGTRLEKIACLVFIVLHLAGCRKEMYDPSPAPYGPGPCSTGQNNYYLFNDSSDRYQFSYSGNDTLRFVRNQTDTFLFIGQGKGMGKRKTPKSSCNEFYNFTDTSEMQFVCSNYSSPLIITQRVLTYSGGQLNFAAPNPNQVFHVFNIYFNDVEFYSQTLMIPQGNFYEISSRTLLTYKLRLEKGIIRKLTLQNGQTWERVP